MPLGTRLDHRQRDPLALVIYAHDPYIYHVADAYHVVWALHVTIGKLANVHQARILETDIDERSKVDDIQNSSLQLHARAQVFDLQDTLLEDGLGQIVAWVAFGTTQGFDDVAQGELADFKLARQFREISLGQLFVQFWLAGLVAHDLGSEIELGEEPDRCRVALGMDPGSIERIFAFGDLEKTGRLRVSRRTDSLDARKLVAVGKRTVLLAIFDDPPGCKLIEARDVSQQGDAGGVQIDADEVNATGNDRLEHFFELLGTHVVLVEPDSDILGVDLDELGQRVLESATDRDAAAQGCIEVGELVAADLAGRVHTGTSLVANNVGELCQDGIGGVRLGRLRRRRRRVPGLGRSRPLGPAMASWLGTLGRGSRSGVGRGSRLAFDMFASRLNGGLDGFRWLSGRLRTRRTKVWSRWSLY